MRTLLLILMAIYSGNCRREQTTQMVCTKENAEILTNKAMKKVTRNLDDYSVTVEEDSSYIFIKYLPKNKMRLGGGGEFTVDKSNCSIKEGKLYQ